MVQLQKDNFWSNTHLNKYPNPESNRINQNLHCFYRWIVATGKKYRPEQMESLLETEMVTNDYRVGISFFLESSVQKDGACV